MFFVENFQTQLPENLVYVSTVYTVLANYKVERVGLFLD